eukprot:CAMPEP_0206435110 /NCGR_PEP_ID=MMETSP0324_2-20121206/9627_1 /ASSEMBLY_ACC=CAM_ASM_000836 /TAXON_ID=2866 /ORGANISM="Crypthecodinium cohnii, Strain Seligo" /LENGTH=31 /DNA_ID= /DNA_START= /DNA_END= /DNA_ORIENTATION=
MTSDERIAWRGGTDIQQSEAFWRRDEQGNEG